LVFSTAHSNHLLETNGAESQVEGNGNAGTKLFNVTIKKKSSEMTGCSTGKMKSKCGAKKKRTRTTIGEE
jgi:hypothetical protein